MHASLSLSSCVLDHFHEEDDDEGGDARSCPSGPVSSDSSDESENNGDMHTSTSRLRVGSYPYVLGTSLMVTGWMTDYMRIPT
jgi:hypothetical protein